MAVRLLDSEMLDTDVPVFVGMRRQWPPHVTTSPVVAAGDDDGGGAIVFCGEDVRREDADGTPLWPAPYRCDGIPEIAYVSGDRVLVLTATHEYHGWGHLGPALLLDRRTGQLVAQLRGMRGAPLDGGRFVLGIEGYGAFDTWLYGPDGAELRAWKSYGHYVPDPDGTIRVIECDRTTPSRGRVVRLCSDGSIERGPALEEGQVPAPIVLDDGTIVFLDAGRLRAVDRALRDRELARLYEVPHRESHRYVDGLERDGDRLVVTLSLRAEDEPWDYTTRRWTFAIDG